MAGVTLYYTLDSYQGWGTQDAVIYKITAESRDEGLEKIADLLEVRVEDLRVVGWHDCWIKSTIMPTEGDDVIEPFGLDYISVQKPGSHPGGTRYWITPIPTVWGL